MSFIQSQEYFASRVKILTFFCNYIFTSINWNQNIWHWLHYIIWALSVFIYQYHIKINTNNFVCYPRHFVFQLYELKAVYVLFTGKIFWQATFTVYISSCYSGCVFMLFDVICVNRLSNTQMRQPTASRKANLPTVRESQPRLPNEP